jgi:hypothetical protein
MSEETEGLASSASQKQRELALSVMEAYREAYPSDGAAKLEERIKELRATAERVKAEYADLQRRLASINQFDDTALPWLLKLLDLVPSMTADMLMEAMTREFGVPASVPTRPKQKPPVAGKGPGRPKKPPQASQVAKEDLLAVIDTEGVNMRQIRLALKFEGEPDPVREVLRELETEGKIRVTGSKSTTKYFRVE